MRIICPICRTVLENAPKDHPHRPFCSARCKTIDLGNWIDEKYRISQPLRPQDVDDDEFLLS